MDYIKSYFHGQLVALRKIKPREVIFQAVNLALVVCSALMIWKSLMVVTGTESPIVVVLSGSMEPGNLFIRTLMTFGYHAYVLPC